MILCITCTCTCSLQYAIYSLVKYFLSCNSTPSPPPPPHTHTHHPHTHARTTTHAGGSSPGYDNPPCSMPYKKQQVSQWVAEQQRRIANIPHPMPPARKFDRPVLAPWGLNRNGNSSIEPQFVNGPPPFFNNPPTIPPPPPQG